MIIKSKSRKRSSFGQLLMYLEAGTDERSMIFAHNLRGASVEEWTQEFLDNEALRLRTRKDSVRLYHEVLSFHEASSQHLDRSTLEELTAEYVRLRAPNGLVLAMSHHDRAHVHVHLAVSGVEYASGKSIRLSQSAFARVKTQLQSYQRERYPELEHSLVAHGSGTGKNNDREHQYRQRETRPLNRERVKDELQEILRRSTSLEDFLSRLKGKDIEPYHRHGITRGVKAHGYKFRLSTLGVAREELERLEQSGKRLRALKRAREVTHHLEFGPERVRELRALRRERHRESNPNE